MTDTLAIQVATPLGTALDTKADSVQVPSVSGELGVLPEHVPLLAALKPGILAYRQDGQEVRAAVGGGYVEVDGSGVRLIAEFYAKAGEVDLETALKDLETAEARLKAHEGAIDETEHKEAQRDLDWALARIELAGGEAS